MTRDKPDPRAIGRMPNKLKARRMEAIRLAAQGYTSEYIAAHLDIYGGKNGVNRLLRRALKALAEEFHQTETWERARALYLQHHYALLEKWLPAAVNGDPRSAELALKILAQIGLTSGFHTIQVRSSGETEHTHRHVLDNEPDDTVIGAILDGLTTLAGRLNPSLPPVIDGQLAQLDGEHLQLPGVLPQQDDLDT